MKKWILSAFIYLGIVIIGYYIYDSVFLEETKVDTHAEEHKTEKTTEHNNHASTENEHSKSEHEHGVNSETESEVNVTIKEVDEKLVLNLKDLTGKPVTNLEVNHEKLLHLIVVDEHLEQYYHLHPEETTPGHFEVKSELEEGIYKAFVDIKPKNLDYQVQPISFKVGNPVEEEHHHGSLTVDPLLEKTVEDNKVSLSTTPLVINEPVTLTFGVHGADLETYLGALGHVVILDEEAQQYLHVHPLEGDTPVFETQFTNPGIYKIWAEFQINGEVKIFPFVVEIK
ncbi:hypothetical protein [Metabacillus sp. B2-18]|uniref:hypothetical protein n=1 Tax=Metabacillus sp. B2-18 TaxID=2897333 RepID=UPI001E369ABA|nr:hypothetical protein [Metabacillus sp. B2-18]UGB32930.1 hypothetical protein LPC09_11120 [Metabacillus sp. B2-18]